MSYHGNGEISSDESNTGRCYRADSNNSNVVIVYSHDSTESDTEGSDEDIS